MIAIADLKHGLSLCLLISLFSHSASAQTYRFSCPAYGGGYLPVSWNIMYSAYIPADNIQGPTSCSNYYYGGDKTKLYKGDGKADIGDGGRFKAPEYIAHSASAAPLLTANRMRLLGRAHFIRRLDRLGTMGGYRRQMVQRSHRPMKTVFQKTVSNGINQDMQALRA